MPGGGIRTRDLRLLVFLAAELSELLGCFQDITMT